MPLSRNTSKVTDEKNKYITWGQPEELCFET